MEYRCEECNKNFSSEDSLNQHNSIKHASKNGQKRKINFKKYFILSAIILTVILLALSINAQFKKPGQYDKFAKCLTEKGTIIYGNDFCSYTAQQINFFGKSKKYLNYIKCTENKKLCDEKGIDITPTWEINGEMYEQIQTFERLSVLTGCEL